MEEFDFKNVQNVMVFLNWEWAGVGTVPDIDRLKEEARHLLIGVSKSTKEHDRWATGGFEAIKQFDGLTLNFNLESWDCYLDEDVVDKEAKKEEIEKLKHLTPFDGLKI